MKIILRLIPFLIVFVAISGYMNINEQRIENKIVKEIDPPYLSVDSQWVDSIMATLTPRERIAQLFMIPAYSNKGDAHIQQVINTIETLKVGGIIFFQGGPGRQAGYNNRLQAASEVPLLVASDAEWGLAMRLDSTMRFPYQMMLGAIRNEKLLYDMGAEIARQCRRIGVHVNFAPVIDVNNNARNPVINSRSFGEDPLNVTRKGFAYMLGMQDHRVLATGKHFPGHGDTDKDSHHTLPVIPHSRERLDSVELVPFRHLINAGMGAVMVAHLHIPAYDARTNRASSLSEEVVTEILREQLGFKGLAITDAMGMSGIAAHNAPGEADLQAILAGNDILLMSKDVPRAIEKIEQAIADSLITQADIDARCRKILQVKKWVDLDHYEPLDASGVYADLHTEEAELLNRKLVENALTLVKNENNLLPFQELENKQFASVSVGSGASTTFQRRLDDYAGFKHFYISKNAAETQFQRLIPQLAQYNVVVVGIHRTSRNPTSFGITPQTIRFVEQLAQKTTVVLDIFGSPYSIANFKGLDNVEAIVMSYEDTQLSNDLSAQLLFGGIAAKGVLPVTATPEYPAGFGIINGQRIRLKYSIPFELKINDKSLEKIDTLALNAIEEEMFPGCQILIAKNGIVFYRKAFGYHTYQKKTPVTNYDLYDLASITKISATLPALMKLTDEEKFNMYQPLSDFLPELDSTNKRYITGKQVLAHRARLASWLPFYLKTIDFTDPAHPFLRTDLYRNTPDSIFSLQVDSDIFLHSAFRDSMYIRIYNTNLRRYSGYRYSDLGFYLFQKTIEEITQQPLDQYVNENFYAPLGAVTLGYCPAKRFDNDWIAPTENDTVYRKRLIQGYVHDYGAAMLGGVGGHAGLFSNANDLAKLMQMYMQMGEYGNRRYITEATMQLYTSKAYSSSRRGHGFDKPQSSGSGPACDSAPPSSFGHTGFTGTIAWADPENELIYIFLSNRIHPDITNRKLISSHLRQKIQQTIYDIILS